MKEEIELDVSLMEFEFNESDDLNDSNLSKKFKSDDLNDSNLSKKFKSDDLNFRLVSVRLENSSNRSELQDLTLSEESTNKKDENPLNIRSKSFVSFHILFLIYIVILIVLLFCRQLYFQRKRFVLLLKFIFRWSSYIGEVQRNKMFELPKT